MSDPARAQPGGDADKLVGAVLAGRYEVTGVLGAGGMGVVLAARQVAVDRRVAVKLLHPNFGVNRHAVARFVREMQVTSRLEHASTVRVYDFGEATHDGATYLFLVMELVVGRTLGKVLAEGRLEQQRVLNIGAQIARALEAAHGEAIVHRDLKPDNVMLADRYGQADTVKVLDFGIARFIDGAEGDGLGTLTAEGAVVGTPAYMSPEQATGSPIGPASDLYSLGVMLFEMATGQVPFSAPTTVSLMVKHVQEPPPRPSEIAKVEPELEALILSCLAKAPEDRPASAREIAETLEALLDRARRPEASRLARIGGAHVEQTKAKSLAADTTKSSERNPVGGGEVVEPEWVAPKKKKWWLVPVGLVVLVVAVVVVVVSRHEPELTIAAATPLVVDAGADVSAPEVKPAEASPSDEPAAPAGCDVTKVEAVRAVLVARGDALPLATAAVAACPAWAVAHVVLGQAHHAAKDWTAARSAFTKAAELAPRWGLPVFDLALVDLASGQPEGARTKLDGLLQLAPTWPDAHLLRAQAGLVLRDFEGARRDAEAATKARPDRPEAWYLLGESQRALAGEGVEGAGKDAYCKAKALGMAAAAARCDAP